MSKKDVIYIDVEDDITDIIKKTTDSKGQIVALVLPKHSAVLKSVVNMKLLKKASDESKKNLVLITAQKDLYQLAGGVGLHMADSLNSRPAIPSVDAPSIDESAIEAEVVVDTQQAVGELQSDAQSEAKEETGSSTESTAEPKITVVDHSINGHDKVAQPAAKDRAKKIAAVKKPKKLKIPNFKSFRNRMFFGGSALVGLIVLWFIGYVILPSASVAIQAQTIAVETDLDFEIKVGNNATDLEKQILAANKQTLKKNITQKFEATGEKDIGQAATGVITITNSCFNPGSLPSGTEFESNSGLLFYSTEEVTIPDAVPSGGSCSGQETTADVNVEAAEGGDQYNLAPTGYSITGYSSVDLSGFGGQMSGGTSEIVKIVRQADINQAADKILDRSHATQQTELRAKFNQGQFVFDETFKVVNGSPTASPAIGEEVTEGVVTIQFTYSMLAVNLEMFEKMLENHQLDSLDESELSILDTGLDKAEVSLAKRINENRARINIITDGFAGPDFDEAALADEIAGQRFSEAVETLKAKSGVRSVDVNLSPFWVFSVPNDASKITISVEVEENNLQ